MGDWEEKSEDVELLWIESDGKWRDKWEVRNSDGMDELREASDAFSLIVYRGNTLSTYFFQIWATKCVHFL